MIAWMEKYEFLAKKNGTVILELHYSSNLIFKEVYVHLGVENITSTENKAYLRYMTFTFMEDDEVVELEIDIEIVRKIEEILYVSKINIIPRQLSMGLDGCTYTLRATNGFQKIQISWWCEPNEEWKPLGEIAELIFGQLPRNIKEIHV